MAREPHGDDSPTLMRRAVDYTDQLAKWPKRVAGIVWLLGVVGALAFWIPTGVRIFKEYGPHELQFHSHVAESKEAHEGFERVDQALDGDLHTILEQNDVVQRQLGTVLERLDTLSTEQRWAQCIRERDREIDRGEVPRECRPFGGGP